MENNLQQLWSIISQRGVAYATLSTDKLKQRIPTDSKKRLTKSQIINSLLVDDFGSDNITKFNNRTRVMKDYYNQETKKRFSK